LAALAPMDRGPKSGPPPLALTGGDSLGTIGGGNHFAELSQVGQVSPHPLAQQLGLERDHYAVLVHSGSRGLGAALHHEWGNKACEGPSIEVYLAVLAGAVRWARTNRLLLTYRGLLALGAARADRIVSDLDVVHNGVEAEGELYLHRKGAAPAEAGAPTLLLGSRGAPSYLLAGCGRTRSLCSSAHGAGRKMTRAEARAKLKDKYLRRSLARTRLGSEVLVDDPELLYEEHPDAYKPIAPIVESLVQSGVAEVVAELLPKVTVKR
jgi:release factor H-coupled RctB family protein